MNFKMYVEPLTNSPSCIHGAIAAGSAGPAPEPGIGGSITVELDDIPVASVPNCKSFQGS